MHGVRRPHLLPKPQRHPQALKLDLEAQRSSVLVVRPTATPLKAQRRQRLRPLRRAAQRCLGGLQLVQLSPCLARLQGCGVGGGTNQGLSVQFMEQRLRAARSVPV